MHNGQIKTFFPTHSEHNILSTPSRSKSKPFRNSFAAVAREKPPHISYCLCFLFILLFCKQATDTQRNWLFWCNFQRLQEPADKVVLTVSPTSVCFIIHYVQMSFSLLLPTPPLYKRFYI